MELIQLGKQYCNAMSSNVLGTQCNSSPTQVIDQDSASGMICGITMQDNLSQKLIITD